MIGEVMSLEARDAIVFRFFGVDVSVADGVTLPQAVLGTTFFLKKI